MTEKVVSLAKERRKRGKEIPFLEAIKTAMYPVPSFSSGLSPDESAHVLAKHLPYMTPVEAKDYHIDFSLLSRPTDGNSLEGPLDYRPDRDEEEGFKG